MNNAIQTRTWKENIAVIAKRVNTNTYESFDTDMYNSIKKNVEDLQSQYKRHIASYNVTPEQASKTMHLSGVQGKIDELENLLYTLALMNQANTEEEYQRTLAMFNACIEDALGL